MVEVNKSEEQESSKDLHNYQSGVRLNAGVHVFYPGTGKLTDVKIAATLHSKGIKFKRFTARDESGNPIPRYVRIVTES